VDTLGSEKGKRLVALLLVLGLLVLTGFLMGRCSGGAQDPETVDEQRKQDLEDIRAVLEPFMEGQTSQYAELSASHDALSKQLAEAQTELAKARDEASTATSALAPVLQRRDELASEVAALKTAAKAFEALLRKANDLRAAAVLRDNSSKQLAIELQRMLDDQQKEYDELYDRFYKLHDRKDTVIAALANATERAAFYKLLDAWWTAVIEEE